jgi:tRNA dimethylallyltransferase
MNPTLVVVVGPTAVGKTKLSIRLAEHYGTEIVSADARQCFRQTTIGTAKPTLEERQQVRHHLVDFLSITQSYNVKQFEQDALAALADIYQRKRWAIATGGSGLYVKTLCYGIDDLPEVPTDLREALHKRWQAEGLEALVDDLARVDPVYHTTVDRQNHRRVLRALEVFYSSGTPFSVFQGRQPAIHRPFRILTIGLTLPRDVLYERIERRVDQMIAAGLVEEARSLYPWRQQQALRTVGYQELFPVFERTYSLEEAIRLIKRNTRRYAKRQLTWFRQDASIRWFEADNEADELIQQVTTYLDRASK